MKKYFLLVLMAFAVMLPCAANVSAQTLTAPKAGPVDPFPGHHFTPDAGPVDPFPGHHLQTNFGPVDPFPGHHL